MRNFEYLICLLGLLLIFACSTKTEQPSWTEETGVYSIPSIGVDYKVPTDVENWSIARNNENIPEIKFCGIDGLTGVCIAIVTPIDLTKNSVAELDSVEICNVLYKVVGQSYSYDMYEFKPIIQRTIFHDCVTWRFGIDITVTSNTDSIDVSYSGYFFDNNNTIGIVLIVVPTGVLNEIGSETVEKYLSGLIVQKK